MDEQLLLNLVRMRYLETSFFMDVSTVTDCRNVAFRTGLDNNNKIYLKKPGTQADVNPVVAVTVSQTPTIVYSPMQGQSFVKRLFAPVPLPVVLNAIQSGWSVKRVFGVFVERINYLRNAPTASGPTPTGAPDYKKFPEMTKVLTTLLRDGNLLMGIDSKKGSRLTVRLLPDEQHREDIRLFKELLDLPQEDNTFTFQENLLGDTGEELRLRLRSVQNAMFYLANGVHVPREHIDAGIVVVTRHANGEIFDWNDLLDTVFSVRCSRERPSGAFVSIPYRDHWFYIADSDLATKSTFMLLSSVFSIQCSDSQTVAPTLTLPINR